MNKTDNDNLIYFLMSSASYLQNNLYKTYPKETFDLIFSYISIMDKMGYSDESLKLIKENNDANIISYHDHWQINLKREIISLYASQQYQEYSERINFFSNRPFLFTNNSVLGFILYCKSIHAIKEKNSHILAYTITILLNTSAGAENQYLIRVINYAGGLNNIFSIIRNNLSILSKIQLILLWNGQKIASHGTIIRLLSKSVYGTYNTLLRFKRLYKTNQYHLLPKGKISQTYICNKNTRSILITRAMGGIGDILMMTPGLKALKEKYPQYEIHFAIPKSFHNILKGLDFIKLKDIYKDDFFKEDYYKVYNFTDCPAARTESATLPEVKQNRINIFSKALGIPPHIQKRIGYIPIYRIFDDETLFAKKILSEHQINPKTAIGIQIKTADTYKDYPWFEDVIKSLAKNYPVILFHNKPIHGYNYPNVIKITDYPIRKSIAILNQCIMLVAADSSFIHIAASINLKSIGIFGPTCGNTFTMHYPNCKYIDLREKISCLPCWCNQNNPCPESIQGVSKCLYKLSPDIVYKCIINTLKK